LYTVTPAGQKPEGQNTLRRSCQPDLAPGDRWRTGSVTGRGQAGPEAETAVGNMAQETPVKKSAWSCRPRGAWPDRLRFGSRSGRAPLRPQPRRRHNWPVANL